MAKPKGDPSPNKGLTESERELIEINFSRYFLDVDIGNYLSGASMLAATGDFENIKPFQTYEEYLREKASAHGDPDAYYYAVMARSDKMMVETYNKRIKAFNEELPKIKERRDANKIKNFFDEMMAFLKTERIK